MEIVYKNVREYIKNTRARIQKLNNQNKLRNICSVKKSLVGVLKTSLHCGMEFCKFLGELDKLFDG